MVLVHLLKHTHTHTPSNPPLGNPPRRGGHTHGRGLGEDSSDDEEVAPKIQASLSFANGKNETTVEKKGTKYIFKVKFEPEAIGYTAYVTLTEKNPKEGKRKVAIATNDVVVKDTEPVDLEFDESELKGQKFENLWLSSVTYDKDGLDSLADVDLKSKSLIINLSKTTESE